ncbi:MAG: transposase [Planctomycetota bacterium]
MSESKLNRTKRHLPHWELSGSTYFVTFRLKTGEMAPAERQLVFDHVMNGDDKFYQLFALVVMPDHVHLLVRPDRDIGLTRMMKGIKGVTARLINELRDTSGRIWLSESYDRIIRDEAEAIEKQNYIIQNPVRAGMAERWQDYPFVYRDELW